MTMRNTTPYTGEHTSTMGSEYIGILARRFERQMRRNGEFCEKYYHSDARTRLIALSNRNALELLEYLQANAPTGHRRAWSRILAEILDKHHIAVEMSMANEALEPMAECLRNRLNAGRC